MFDIITILFICAFAGLAISQMLIIWIRLKYLQKEHLLIKKKLDVTELENKENKGKAIILEDNSLNLSSKLDRLEMTQDKMAQQMDRMSEKIDKLTDEKT